MPGSNQVWMAQCRHCCMRCWRPPCLSNQFHARNGCKGQSQKRGWLYSWPGAVFRNWRSEYSAVPSESNPRPYPSFTRSLLPHHIRTQIHHKSLGTDDGSIGPIACACSGRLQDAVQLSQERDVDPASRSTHACVGETDLIAPCAGRDLVDRDTALAQ